MIPCLYSLVAVNYMDVHSPRNGGIASYEWNDRTQITPMFNKTPAKLKKKQMKEKRKLIISKWKLGVPSCVERWKKQLKDNNPSEKGRFLPSLSPSTPLSPPRPPPPPPLDEMSRPHLRLLTAIFPLAPTLRGKCKQQSSLRTKITTTVIENIHFFAFSWMIVVITWLASCDKCQKKLYSCLHWNGRDNL